MGNKNQVRDDIFSQRRKKNGSKWSLTIKATEYYNLVDRVINDITRGNFNPSDPATQAEFLNPNITSMIKSVAANKLRYIGVIFHSVMAKRQSITDDQLEAEKSKDEFRKGLRPFVLTYDPSGVLVCDNIINFLKRSYEAWTGFSNSIDNYVIRSNELKQADITSLIQMFDNLRKDRQFFKLDNVLNITRS